MHRNNEKNVQHRERCFRKVNKMKKELLKIAYTLAMNEPADTSAKEKNFWINIVNRFTDNMTATDKDREQFYEASHFDHWTNRKPPTMN
jgi:hypothetical protein